MKESESGCQLVVSVHVQKNRFVIMRIQTGNLSKLKIFFITNSSPLIRKYIGNCTKLTDGDCIASEKQRMKKKPTTTTTHKRNCIHDRCAHKSHSGKNHQKPYIACVCVCIYIFNVGTFGRKKNARIDTLKNQSTKETNHKYIEAFIRTKVRAAFVCVRAWKCRISI